MDGSELVTADGLAKAILMKMGYQFFILDNIVDNRINQKTYI